MCSVYKPHKEDMLDQNTLPPIPCMRPEKGLYNCHDRSSQSFFNFLEQKITHKNIVGLYNRHVTSQIFNLECYTLHHHAYNILLHFGLRSSKF